MTIVLAPPADAGPTEGAAAPRPENGEAFAAVVEGVVARQGTPQDGAAPGGDGNAEGGRPVPVEGAGETPAAPGAGDASADAAAVAAASVIAALMGLTPPVEAVPLEVSTDAMAVSTADLAGVDAVDAATVGGEAPVADGAEAAAAAPVPADVPEALAAQVATTDADDQGSVPLPEVDGTTSAASTDAPDTAGARPVTPLPSAASPAGDGTRIATSQAPTTPVAAQPAGDTAEATAPVDAPELVDVEAATAATATSVNGVRSDQGGTSANAAAGAIDVQPTAPLAHQPRVAAPQVDAPTPVPHVVDVPEVTDPNIARIGGAIRSLGDGERHQLTLGLTPEHLGRVTVDVVTGSDGGVHLHLRVDRPEGAAALNNATHGLRADLEASGLRLDRVEVSIGQGSANGRDHRSGTHHDATDLPRPARPAADMPEPEPLRPPAVRRPLRADGLDLSL